MKKVLYLIVFIFIIPLFTGCFGKLIPTPEPDPADKLVGNYQYTDKYYLKWGGDAKSDMYNGTFTLRKISANKVQMTGDWCTIGTITGDTIQFDFCPQSDKDGYYNYTFGSGTFGGGAITFTYSGTGSRTFSNGISYPWNINGNVFALKIE